METIINILGIIAMFLLGFYLSRLDNKLNKIDKRKIDLESMSDKIDKALETMTKEEIDEFFPSSNISKGWISIEKHLPMMLAEDVVNGGTKYKVKYSDGTIDYSTVSDHNVWFEYAKIAGITHWYND